MNEALNEGLAKLTRDILASYRKDERMQRIGETFLPSRTKIVEIIDVIRQLLFPGYFGHQKFTNQSVQYHVGNLLMEVGTSLAEQINHCIRTDRTHGGETDDLCWQQAEQLAHDFLAKIPKIRQKLILDAQAAFDGDPAAKNISETVYCYPGFYAVTVYRIAHELWKQGIFLMARIMTEHAHGITGTDIHPGAMIGKSFFIDHATGVVIGETTEIGNHVKIYQGVTLGALSFPKDERGRLIKGLRRHPKIEDNVTIYANATILGGNTIIGKGVTVAGNTFVTESITAQSVVAHEQPKLHVRKKKKAGSR